MSIQVGDKLPSIKLKRLTAEGMQDVDTGDVFVGKKVVLFAIPGAFTPACSNSHLPGYVSRADDIKAKGVNEIVCLAVNDPFVMKAWSDHYGATDKVAMLPDGNAEFTRAIGLDFDGSGLGMATRAKRFSLVAEDGVVKSLDIEENAGQVTVSGADSCMTKL